jgi:hypothetical protein
MIKPRNKQLRRHLARLGLSLVWLLLAAAPALAVSSIKDYAARLVQAEELTDGLTEGPHRAQEVVNTMAEVRRLLPAQEEVAFDEQIVRVNNAWLHAAVDEVNTLANGDPEQRRARLIEIANRLFLLEQQVSAAVNPPAASTAEQQARLEKILARPEYLPEEQRESALQKWFKKLRAAFARLLERLFGGRAAPTPTLPTSGSINGVRLALVLIGLVALAFALVALLKRLRHRRAEDDEPEVREVLGEELPDDVTAADLLANASALAKQGDYRSAIRRAYIALLCELEQRGKLRLHRAKTNRDYLNALRQEAALHSNFSVMTQAFEHTWYGRERAEADEYEDFITIYRETTKI